MPTTDIGQLINTDNSNLWADGYDLSVNISNDENTYPFGGYKDNTINIYVD